MATIYTQLFDNIFQSSRQYIIHDFNELQGQKNNENKLSFCLSSYKKIFDTIIQLLEKTKYNGEIIIPTNLYIGRNIDINTNEIIKNAICIKKNKIKQEKEIYKLINARPENGTKNRIIAIPFDGFISFLNGQNDFSTILIHQQKNTIDEEYSTQQVMIFSPLTDIIYTYDVYNGFTCNKKKIADKGILPSQKVISIFVDNYAKQFSFNINKLFQISEFCFTSTSIFKTISSIAEMKANLCIYHKNEDISQTKTQPNNFSIEKIIDSILPFCIKTTSLTTNTIGSHVLIGEKHIVEKFTK